MLVAVVFEVTPLPKLQNRFVIVPLEASVKITASGDAPLVGDAVNEATGGVISPQQDRAVTDIVSTYQPLEPTLLSEAQRQRSWTVCPEADGGSNNDVVMKPPEFPLQQRRPASGLW